METEFPSRKHASRGMRKRPSLQELYEHHAGEALRFAYLLTGNRPDAEDLLQDAFLKLAGRLIHIRDPGAIGAYLHRTIANLAASSLRRRRLERRSTALATTDNSESRTMTTVDWDANLRSALFQLPVRQRLALVLRFSEGLSSAEIASFLRCSDAAARQLISRGLNGLRRRLNLEVPTDGT
jgi:RNA polymerase sigma factor (sigma-70 family)